MRVVSLILLVAVSLMALACTGTAPEPTPSLTPESTPVPTPDIAATIAAGIAATREAEASAASTIEARVAATLAAPTATPIAILPTATATPTPRPTATLWPTPAPSLIQPAIRDIAGRLYDCLQENAELKETFELLIALGATSEGMTEEGAKGLVEIMLSNREFFILSFEEAAVDDSLFVSDIELLMAGCSGTNPKGDTLLSAYAVEHAGGPGAIYVGDLAQLAGPAITDDFLWDYGTDLGDDAGNVPLYALEQHRWIYESSYYQSLLEKAKLANPTPLTSKGENIVIQHACINALLLWCKHLETYFVPNVERRTNGQIVIDITSFPELGVAGTDSASLLAGGTLSMAEIYGGYVGGEFPTLAVQYIWGLWPDHETHYKVLANLAPDLDRVIIEEIGAQVLMRNWIAGDDQFIFSNKKLENLEDFVGLKTRSHSAELSDWINHMGAEAQFMAFAEVYTALERGILDAGVTGANPGLSQRWYEVTYYMNGRLYSFNATINAVHQDVWDSIPGDLQQILIEEGAKHELEALRLASIQNITGLQRNIDAGLEFVEFGQELRELSFQAGHENVLPNWLRRLGYPIYEQEVVAVFNRKIGPYVGLRIERNGSIVKVPITEGPHVGKTMEQVLSE